MNNKGFTLVEVLAVIVIIGIIGLIAVPSVVSSINSSKNTSYKVLINNIEIAGQALYEEIEFMGEDMLYSYTRSGKGEYLFLGESNEITVNLQTLVSNGFLKGTKNTDFNLNKNSMILKNPITDEDMGDCEVTIIKSVTDDGQYKVTYEVDVKEVVEVADYCPKADDFKKG